MSRSRKNGLILLIMALILAACFSSGMLLYPKLGDASSQKNESPVFVSSKSPQPSSNPVYYSDKAAILSYHHFNSKENSLTISAQRFRSHIETLQQLGYNFISLAQLNDFLAGRQSLPPNAVAVTIDDGYESVYRHAYPVLAEYNIPATVFVIVKMVGESQNQIPKLSWAQMREMQVWGIDFESHTYDSHHFLNEREGRTGPALTSRGYLPDLQREESQSEYQDRILQDLILAKTILEYELDDKVNCLALPYGLQNSEVKMSARLAGYDCVFTVEPGLVDQNSDPSALGRINAGQDNIEAGDLHQIILQYVNE